MPLILRYSIIISVNLSYNFFVHIFLSLFNWPSYGNLIVNNVPLSGFVFTKTLPFNLLSSSLNAASPMPLR